MCSHTTHIQNTTCLSVCEHKNDEEFPTTALAQSRMAPHTHARWRRRPPAWPAEHRDHRKKRKTNQGRNPGGPYTCTRDQLSSAVLDQGVHPLPFK
mmetsp:Transcript_28051/g.41305  ORF Transcript_28051/g.41305 Transcript_28051/m.41305 type:complete len:96 (-) Transcript_28051:87-374(-)